MNIKELKKILKYIPDKAEIFLSVNGNDGFTDDCSCGQSEAYNLTIEGNPVFYLTSGSLEKKPEDLNYANIKTIKHWARKGATLKHDDSGEPLYNHDYFKKVWERIEGTFPKNAEVV